MTRVYCEWTTCKHNLNLNGTNTGICQRDGITLTDSLNMKVLVCNDYAEVAE